MIARATLVLAGLLLAGCARVRVESRTYDRVAVEALETYAWETRPLEQVRDEVETRLRRAVDEGLAARGLREAGAGEADAHLVRDVTFEIETRTADPWFWYAYADRYELGVLFLELSDAATGEPLWTGTARDRLRKVAQTIGTLDVRFADVERAREWPVGAMVEALLEELPRPVEEE